VTPFKAVAAGILALATGPLGGRAPFTRDVPGALPDFRGWERISGDVQLSSPRVSVEYEFYVNPQRPMIYEIVRYRIVEVDFVEGRRYPVAERLQWDRDGRDLRRFECVAEPGGSCAWREMSKAGDDYRREMPVLLWLYGLHNRLSREPQSGDRRHLAAPRRIVIGPVAG
jgi:hypothetical protein